MFTKFKVKTGKTKIKHSIFHKPAHSLQKNTNSLNKKENNSKNHVFILIIVLLFIFLLKLWLSFSLNSLNIDSYYALYQSNQIRKNGIIDFQIHYLDNSALPLTEYILTAGSLFADLEIIAKILSALFVTLLSFLVYLIAKELTQNKSIGLQVLIFSGFIPILFSELINNYTKEIFILLCYLIATLYFVKSISDIKYSRHFIISLIILILVSPLSMLFILNFIIYFLMLSTEKIKIRMSELETFVFSLILGGWIYIILYKDALVARGILKFLHPLIENTAAIGSIVSIAALIGIIPFLLGVIGMYYVLEQKSSRANMFIISIILSIVLSMFVGIVTLSFGIILLGIYIVIMSTVTLNKLFNSYSLSKIKKTYKFLIVIGIILFLITSVVPSITGSLASVKKSLSNQDKLALQWLGKTTNGEPLIMSKNEEAYAISFFTEKHSILSSPRFSNDVDKGLIELNDFFEISLNVEAIRVLSIYDIDYVFISQNLADSLTEENMLKFQDPCFERVYGKNDIQIFKRLCSLKNEEKYNKELFEDNDDN